MFAYEPQSTDTRHSTLLLLQSALRPIGQTVYQDQETGWAVRNIIDWGQQDIPALLPSFLEDSSGL